jgi:hypothetical protein
MSHSNWDYDYLKPHRPIGPTAADFNGPGPQYKLPSLTGYKRHDPQSVHPKAPAWTIPGRYPDRNIKNDTPGPIYDIARDHEGGVTIKGRLPSLRPGSAPGPGAYSPEHSGPSAKSTAPSYSIGGRHPTGARDLSPGPGAYSPERYSGEGRGATIAGRYQTTSEDHSPGPAAYKPRTGRSGPEYSIKGRYNGEAENVGPGPAEYYPGIGDSTKRTLPSWSMGGRHRGANVDDLPGPGNNNVFGA